MSPWWWMKSAAADTQLSKERDTMCGIVGYIGQRPAAPLLIDGLRKLEYRGYDSAGIALMRNGKIEVTKTNGRLSVLSEKIDGGKQYTQTIGIGHTRWATHGKPSDANAHPHTDAYDRFAIVHNGIIENFQEIKDRLIAEGVTFRSETDTEVIAHLLAKFYDGNLIDTITHVTEQLHGSFALGILCADEPDVLYAVCQSSPLIIGLDDSGYFIASDIPAVLSHTRKIIQMSDGNIARLTKESVTVFNENGRLVDKPIITIDWDVDAAEKGGYDHFMLKEIMEQPRALESTIMSRIHEDNRIVLDDVALPSEFIKTMERVYIVACGSAYHAGVVGKYFIEKIARLPVEVDVASEFRYRDPLVNERTLVVIISQSGETADTLAALREAKTRGARVLSIVNVVGSTIARESDDVLYTRAGPEIAVATTKGYTTQVSMLYLLGIYLSEHRGVISSSELSSYIEEIKSLPQIASQCLRDEKAFQAIATRLSSLEHAYFIGRNMDYAVAMEASLKLKEISYIHSEAYAAGELKHGTISLIEEGTCVVALACHTDLIEKTLSNIKEVKARGAYVLVLTDVEHADLFTDADDVMVIPCKSAFFSAIPQVIPMQLLAYYIALYRGCDIDKPRNLAKSVTVE